MSLVKATAALNRIAGQYNLLEILNRKQCRRPDPTTCTLTPQKIDQLQKYLIYIYKMLSKTYDPILEKLYMLLNAKLPNNNNRRTLKAGRKRKGKTIKGGAGGIRALMQVINIIVLIFIYAYSFNQGKIPKDELLHIKEISDVVQQCSIQNQVSFLLKPNEESPPLPLVVTAKVDGINDILERIQKSIPRSERTSIMQTMKASINMQQDLARNKTIFRFHLLSLDKEMTANEDDYAIEMERYKTETTLSSIIDHLSVMLYNIVVSRISNFYDIDRNAEIVSSFQIYYDRSLQQSLQNAWHIDGFGDSYVSLLQFPNTKLEVGTELSGFIWNGKYKSSLHEAFKDFSTLSHNLSMDMVTDKEDRTFESTRLRMDGLVTIKNMIHNSPVETSKYQPGHNVYLPEFALNAKVTTESGNREIGNKILQDKYYHTRKSKSSISRDKIYVVPNEKSNRNFVRGWVNIYGKNYYRSDIMYEFWQEKIPNMLQSFAVEDSEDSNVEAYLGNIRLPREIAQIYYEILTLANLEKLSGVAPDRCNEIVTTSTSFENDWPKLQGFSIGGRKKKNINRTRKK